MISTKIAKLVHIHHAKESSTVIESPISKNNTEIVLVENPGRTEGGFVVYQQ